MLELHNPPLYQPLPHHCEIIFVFWESFVLRSYQKVNSNFPSQEWPAAPDTKWRVPLHLEALSAGGEWPRLRGDQLHLLRLQHLQLLHLLRVLPLPLWLVCRWWVILPLLPPSKIRRCLKQIWCFLCVRPWIYYACSTFIKRKEMLSNP